MLEMKIMNSHSDWLNARRSAIGGSDAASIIGLNPWKSNLDLWREKTGIIVPEDISNNPLVKYGTDAEPLLRSMFQLDHPDLKVFYQENNLWINSEIPFSHASLDGWIEDQNGRKGILEIKTTTIQSASQKEKWQDRIPDNYYCQILHYLMVTGWDFAILKAQLKFDSEFRIPYQIRHYLIERSDVEDEINYLKEQERKFWKAVQEGRQPAMILPEI